jgi:hypothetical protein
MAQMNTGRIVTGGLAAGLVMNVIDFLANGLWLGPRWTAQMQLFHPNLAQRSDTGSMIGWIVVDFLAGISVVWLYAAIRPRLGPGPKTALCAGFALWFITRLTFASYVFNGFFTWRLITVSSICSLVAALAGAYLGGWLYKEEAAPA